MEDNRGVAPRRNPGLRGGEPPPLPSPESGSQCSETTSQETRASLRPRGVACPVISRLFCG